MGGEIIGMVTTRKRFVYFVDTKGRISKNAPRVCGTSKSLEERHDCPKLANERNFNGQGQREGGKFT
jgi:hypothetical protein